MDFSKESLDYERRFNAGAYLTGLRSKLNKSMTAVAKCVGISTAYLSEIEKGLKLPSDLLIRNLSDFYKIDENELFRKYGKIPLFAREEFQKQESLQTVLAEISRKNIPEEHKQELYDNIMKLYREFLEQIELSKTIGSGKNAK